MSFRGRSAFLRRCEERTDAPDRGAPSYSLTPQLPIRMATDHTKINAHSPQWYGWLSDVPDHRDRGYSGIAPRLRKMTPSGSRQPDCSPVEDQGQIGSCTAIALVGALGCAEPKDGAPFADLSPAGAAPLA